MLSKDLKNELVSKGTTELDAVYPVIIALNPSNDITRLIFQMTSSLVISVLATILDHVSV